MIKMDAYVHREARLMKKHVTAVLFLIVLGGLFLFPQAARSQDGESGEEDQVEEQSPQSASDYGWPQMVQGDAYTITIYQPRYEYWNDNELTAKAAVSVKAKSSAHPVYGVAHFTARTSIDHDRRMVVMETIRINRVDFPNKKADAAAYRDIIAGSTDQWPRSVDLDRFRADLAINRAEAGNEGHATVKNEAPRIFYSEKPAVLVLIDGEPSLRALPGTDLMRVINTRALLVYDKNAGIYYLYLSDHWNRARGIKGPWSRAENPPASLDDVLEEARRTSAADLLNKAKTKGPVRVFLSTGPAEVLVIKGKPNLQPIDGTELLFCANSDNDIFLNLVDQKYYILLSGRWFRGKTLEAGPWTFVPGRDLPRDFARIPAGHPKGRVLASIPGTPQAKEAVISASIPQTAAVRRDRAGVTVTYDGDPVFKPIEGTPLKYAVNTAVPVIEVDQQSYFCVVNGVWFSATGPDGPWAVTDHVPAVIYTIPTSSPIHYVVYVRIYDSTPTVIYVGYTPGYYGALIGVDGTVIYGTGYYYDPWIGTVWYGYPVTWGCGVCLGWYAWGWDWGWGCYYGWRPVFRPWWGPWWGWGPVWWHPWAVRDTVTFHTNAYHYWHGGAVIHRVHVYPWGPVIVPGGFGRPYHRGGFYWRGWRRRR